MSLKAAAAGKKSRMSVHKEQALQEVAKEPMKRLNVNLPESLLREFKVKAAAEGRDMSSLVGEWVRGYLEE